MEFIQNQEMKIISSMQNQSFQVIPSNHFLFDCVKKESNDMISDIKDIRVETNYLLFDVNVDISSLGKKVDSLNVELDNIMNTYEHGDGLVISGDIIQHGNPTENCKDIVFNLFWYH